MRVLWSLVLVVSPAIASPIPVAPAPPTDLSLDYSSLELVQVRKPLPKDPKLALCGYDRAECEAACTAGSKLSCTRLGEVLTREKDVASARKVLASACAKKTWSACILLADLEDDPEGKRLLAPCNAGHARSCTRLAERATDAGAIARYLDLGCKAGDWEACNVAIREATTPAKRHALVKQAFAGSTRGSPLTCPGRAKPLRGVDREPGRGARPTWSCSLRTQYDTVILPFGPYLVFASEEDARVGGIVSERGERGPGGPSGTIERFDERGRLLLRRRFVGGAQIGESFELAYDDTKLVSVKRTTWVDGRATGARELHLAPIEMIDIGDVDARGEKAGTWIRVRAGRVVRKATYLDDQPEGDVFEWDDKSAFVSRTTYERGVPIRRRVPKGTVLVDDPTFTKKR